MGERWLADARNYLFERLVATLCPMSYKYNWDALKGDKTWRNKPPIEVSSIDFAKPGEQFDEEWIDKFDEIIIEEGDVVGTHSWNSGNPGAGAGMTIVYRFRGLFFTTTILELMAHMRDLARPQKLWTF